MKPSNSRRQRVLVFVDSQNIGCNPTYRLNPHKFKEWLAEKGELVCLEAFFKDCLKTIVPRLQWKEAGFRIRSVRPWENQNGATKGDIDKVMMFHLGKALVENEVRKGDLVVLVTGDGDFDFIVEYLCNQDIDVQVVAFADYTAPPLKIHATEFIPLEQLEKELLDKKQDSSNGPVETDKVNGYHTAQT
ncbi:MAG: hypothetical protein KatS3mg040_1782 [Candidatus Kapaibacterium sp.]|nr:MAG: hypothetical protein KatS3mg040_1782 [Candidatus Kapabacteria bacterium]